MVSTAATTTTTTTAEQKADEKKTAEIAIKRAAAARGKPEWPVERDALIAAWTNLLGLTQPQVAEISDALDKGDHPVAKALAAYFAACGSSDPADTSGKTPENTPSSEGTKGNVQVHAHVPDEDAKDEDDAPAHDAPAHTSPSGRFAKTKR